MFSLTAIWLLTVPLLCLVVSLLLLKKFAPEHGLDTGQLALVSVLSLVFGTVIIFIAFFLGKGFKTSDTEIWNGQITSKVREHGTYEESYQCNCRPVQSCTGSGAQRSCTTTTVCDTCYRTHYTVDWKCNSTIGKFDIDGADSLSSRVYDKPDPARYLRINQGDPVSKTHNYTNYVKAVPESLIRPAAESLKLKYVNDIPAYPDQIFDIYRINRVLTNKVNVPDIQKWNDGVSEMLKTLGPLKQVNVVILITNQADPNYFYAVQDSWVNGKKNDVIVVIGAPEFPKKAEWVNVMAFTDSDMVKVKIRDDILELENLTVDTVLPIINTDISQHFKRKKMNDFKYLENEIDPPQWIMVSAVVLILLEYFAGMYMLIRRSNVNNFVSRRRNRYGRY